MKGISILFKRANLGKKWYQGDGFYVFRVYTSHTRGSGTSTQLNFFRDLVLMMCTASLLSKSAIITASLSAIYHSQSPTTFFGPATAIMTRVIINRHHRRNGLSSCMRCIVDDDDVLGISKILLTTALRLSRWMMIIVQGDCFKIKIIPSLEYVKSVLSILLA